MPLNKLIARMLETPYAQLRRCRIRCDGKPFIEHTTEAEHDCVQAKCRPHKCKPMASSSVRQIHSILSGVLNAAVRWDWISSNPPHATRLAGRGSCADTLGSHCLPGEKSEATSSKTILDASCDLECSRGRLNIPYVKSAMSVVSRIVLSRGAAVANCPRSLLKSFGVRGRPAGGDVVLGVPGGADQSTVR